MTKVAVEYINFDPQFHLGFPVISKCRVYEKNGIINLYLEGDRIFNDLIDDIGYDSQGKYISVSIGQWHNMQTGLSISNEDFYDLDEHETYLYDYVSFLIKIYNTGDYRACYHNDFDRKVKISFIPFDTIKFNENNCDKIYFQFN